MPSRLIALIAFAGTLAAACGAAAAPAPSSTATTTTTTAVPSTAATATAAPSTSAVSGGVWTVTSASKATVRVREQLVGVNAPSDAVLTATGAAGSFALKADGSFSSDSKISFDLNTLASDEPNRDGFVKRTTLAVQQFPSATFVPTKTSGLTLPLAASGDLKFTLTGQMTIHGVTKEITFDVTAVRNGGQLTATATAAPALTFEAFGMSPPSVPFRVVSVTDEIRLAVSLVATGPAS